MSHGQQTPGRTGRPPLTERRKAETRLEVARAAVGLFLAKGVADTSAEEIAAEAGISARTLWRYFPTKESCVKPLLTGGIAFFADYLRAWRSDQDAADLVRSMVKSRAVNDQTDAATTFNLVRLTRTEPGLRAVWLETHHEAEPVFAQALAQRAGLPEPDLTISVQAAMINAALRVAVEHYATHPEATNYEATIKQALWIAAGCVSGGPTAA